MTYKKLYIILLFLVFSLIGKSSLAFWVWTPETNKWVNPKYSVKETPAEQLVYAKGFYEAKQYPEAYRELKKLIKHYPRAREAPEAQYYIGLCFEDQNKLMEAFKAYQVVIDKYPFSDRAVEIVKKQYEIGNILLEGKDKKGHIVQAIIGDNFNVIDVFRAVIKNAPYGEFAAPSQYKIGLYLQEKQLFQEARDEFEKAVNDYPQSEWAKAARYQIALSDAKRSSKAEYNQRVTQTAVKEFKEFVQEYPEAELSDSAKSQIQKLQEKDAENNFLVARYYEKRRQYASAVIYYNIVVDQYSDTSWAAKALVKVREIGAKK